MYPRGKEGSYTVPKTVRYINNYAFCNSRVNNIVLPDNLISIGDYALDVYDLRSVTIPASVTKIGGGAFHYDTILIGQTGSYAEKWASENGWEFFDVNSVKRTTGRFKIKYSETVNSQTFLFEPPADGVYILRFKSENTFSVITNNYSSCTEKNEYVKEIKVYKGVINFFRISDYSSNVIIEISAADDVAVKDYGVYEIKQNEGADFLFKAEKTGLYSFVFESDQQVQASYWIVSEDDSNWGDSVETPQSVVVEMKKGDVLAIDTYGSETGEPAGELKVIIRDSVSGNLPVPVTVGELYQPQYYFSNYELTLSCVGAISSESISVSENLWQDYFIYYYTKSIYLCEGITEIAEHTFINFSSAEKIFVPSSVAWIDENAFTYPYYGGHYDEKLQDWVDDPPVEKIPDNLTIVGIKGSFAETYAKEHNIPFEEVTLQNTSYLSSASAKLGESVTINCKAINEFSCYYIVMYRLSGSSQWTTLQVNKSRKTADFQPASAGQYEVRVTVKDSEGNTSRKTMNLIVAES